jgi:hypothetical protein
MMLSSGSASLREHTLKRHSQAIESSDALFPRVLAYLISEFCIPYDVEFQPYSTASTAKNKKEREEMLIDFEGSITGLITVGAAPGSLNQTLRTPWKPYHWLTWVGTQPLSMICNSWTVELDDEASNPVFKTCIGVASRESIAWFRDFSELDGCYFYTEDPRKVFMKEILQPRASYGFTSPWPSTYFDDEDLYGACMATGDQITLTVRHASPTESEILFALRCGATVHTGRRPMCISTNEMNNYVPFILTQKRVRLLISSSDT